jgi:hypothetical protein
MQDKDKNNSKEWERALCKFSKFSDGFFVLGFDRQNQKKIAFSLIKNAACKDGLYLIESGSNAWMDQAQSNQSGNEA